MLHHEQMNLQSKFLIKIILFGVEWLKITDAYFIMGFINCHTMIWILGFCSNILLMVSKYCWIFQLSYAEQARGDARKKWLQHMIVVAETSGAIMGPVYKSVFDSIAMVSWLYYYWHMLICNFSSNQGNNNSCLVSNVAMKYAHIQVHGNCFVNI